MKHRHVPRRPGWRVAEDGTVLEQVLVRQVLEPGSRKAAVHPWAALLWAARNGKDEATLAELRERAGIVSSRSVTA